MSSELSIFAARVRDHIAIWSAELSSSPDAMTVFPAQYDFEFNALAVMLFALQFNHNESYRKLCVARGVLPNDVNHWTQIPAVPPAAFKEFEMTSLPPAARTRVFHSSGTTGQQPSRHFHNAESLELYEASLWPWMQINCGSLSEDCRFVSLTPPAVQVPHSSLVHMFDFAAKRLATRQSVFIGCVGADGSWGIDYDAALNELGASLISIRGNGKREESKCLSFALTPTLSPEEREAVAATNCISRVRSKNPAAEFIQEAGSVSPSPGGEGRDEGGCSPKVFLVGTAFSFVHLLDELAARDVRLELPPGSQVLETGGYKGRSRVLQKSELHALITERLGVPQSQIICEYGMSELSSQAYQTGRGARGEGREEEGVFQFPPWVRARVVSPETGGEVADGATGLLSIVDLANVFSVMAIQTEDLAIRRGAGFELLGRAALAEPRGCSLTSV